MRIYAAILSLLIGLNLSANENKDLGEILIRLPSDVRIEKTVKDESVVLNVVESNGQQLLIVYIGKSEFKTPGDRPINAAFIARSICGVEYFDAIWGTSRLRNRDTRLRRISNDPFPAIVVAMYRRLDSKRAEMADLVISSIEFNESYYNKIRKHAG